MLINIFSQNMQHCVRSELLKIKFHWLTREFHFKFHANISNTVDYINPVIVVMLCSNEVK